MNLDLEIFTWNQTMAWRTDRHLIFVQSWLIGYQTCLSPSGIVKMQLIRQGDIMVTEQRIQPISLKKYDAMLREQM